MRETPTTPRCQSRSASSRPRLRPQASRLARPLPQRSRRQPHRLPHGRPHNPRHRPLQPRLPRPQPGRLRVDRRTLPPATRNLPYAQAVPVAGGTPPYAIRIVEGRLPAGLVLSGGSIAGTARVQGYYPFVVAVTDASKPPVTIAQPLGIRVIILQPDTALVLDPLSIDTPAVRPDARRARGARRRERPPAAGMDRRRRRSVAAPGPIVRRLAGEDRDCRTRRPAAAGHPRRHRHGDDGGRAEQPGQHPGAGHRAQIEAL